MNDFTKDELETLAACVSVYAKDEPADYLPLFDKLCSLINNYCEHEYIENPNNGEYMLCSMCGDTFQC